MYELTCFSIHEVYFLFSRYARKHFGSVDVVPPEELRKIMALLAFTPETVCDRYKVRLRRLSLLFNL